MPTAQLPPERTFVSIFSSPKTKYWTEPWICWKLCPKYFSTSYIPWQSSSTGVKFFPLPGEGKTIDNTILPKFSVSPIMSKLLWISSWITCYVGNIICGKLTRNSVLWRKLSWSNRPSISYCLCKCQPIHEHDHGICYSESRESFSATAVHPMVTTSLRT